MTLRFRHLLIYPRVQYMSDLQIVCGNEWGSKTAGFKFLPRDDSWTMRDFHELLVACDENLILKGCFPAKIAEGGLEWKQNGKGTCESMGRQLRMY